MEVLQLKCETADELEVLDLSDNCLKGEDVAVSVSGSFLFAFVMSCCQCLLTVAHDV